MTTKPEKKPSSFTLTLAMIARDEERCIGRALRSLQGAADEGLIDEIVVVDTGSIDTTVSIARDLGATVHSFAWIDDFSAARNAAMAHATGDWVLMLDADEWFADLDWQALGALRTTAPTFVGEIEVVSSIEVRAGGLDGAGPSVGQTNQVTQTRGWIPRLLPRAASWSGTVHEQPVWHGPVRRTSLRVHHDGYAPVAKESKRGRNASLLEAAVASNPHDAHLLLQWGRALESDARTRGDFSAASDVYLRALAECPHEVPERHDLVVRLLYTLSQAERTAEGLSLAEAEGARWNNSADFHFCLGDLLLAHGLQHPEAEASVLGLIVAAWQRCLELGDSDFVGSVAGRGSHLAAHNLAVLYDALGRPDEANALRSEYLDHLTLR